MCHIISLTEVNLSVVFVLSDIIFIHISEVDVFFHFVLSGVLFNISEIDTCSDT